MKSEREAIKKLILTAGQEKPRVIVAIDGRCAAGKTTLADHLKQELGTTVFHMDDFFSPPRAAHSGAAQHDRRKRGLRTVRG